MATSERQIAEIVSRAATEIAAAVRAEVKAQVELVRRLRSTARPSDGAPTRAAATANSTKGARKGGRKGIVSEADLVRTLEYIAKNPGQRTEQIRAALKLESDLGGKILAKLRSTGKVKMQGQKRATTYRAA